MDANSILGEYVKKLQNRYLECSSEQKESVLFILKSILECKDIEEIVFYLKKIDSITSFPSRDVLMRDITSLDSEAMLIILHINQVDAIKQLYGFEVLKEVIVDKAKKISQIVKECEATLYSINFEKFAILVKDKRYFDKYLSILKYHIFNNIDNYTYYTDDGDKILSDFSAGIAYGSKYLHHRANVALHEAILSKQSYKIYVNDTPRLELKKKSLDKHKVYKTALHEGYIIPYFQPIVSSEDESIMKYEALARILLPNGEVIAPNEFLNTAIEDRTFEFFTRQMMQKVFNVYAKNRCEFSMNITYENIKSPSMLDYIKNRLDKYGGDRMTFEIVETEEIGDYKIVENFILMVKAYGVKVSIDDFGSGYSNFTNLIKLNIDYIKIDGSITTKLLNEEKAKVMVQGLINFAKSINIKTIGEFVSSKELFLCMKELGVDYVQGYYHGMPKSAKEYSLVE